MGTVREFPWEGLLLATPEAAWNAITVNSGGWLWPIDYEQGEGGTENGLSDEGGVITVWEPPARFGTRVEGEDGWFNELSYRLEPRANGTYLRYLHQTVMGENVEVEADACRQHTDFYYHTLGQYLAHFAGQTAGYVSFDPSPEMGGFAGVKRKLGLPDDAAVGDQIRLEIPGLETQTATVDYLAPNFAGLRTDDALIRIFGRDAWDWPIGISLHLFGDPADEARIERSWRDHLGAPAS